MPRLKRNRRRATPTKAEENVTATASPSSAISIPRSLTTIEKDSFWKCLTLLVCVSILAANLIKVPIDKLLPITKGGIITKKDNTKTCAKHHNGFIVANMNGRMANNLFQIALAHRLSEELCWPVIFKEQWQGTFPHNPRAVQCFPKAVAGDHVRLPNSTIIPQDIRWFKTMNISEQTSQHWTANNLWAFYNQVPYKEHDPWYQKWREASSQDGTALSIANIYEYDFADGWDDLLVEKLQHPGNQTFVTNLYFKLIHRSAWIPQNQTYDTVRTVHLSAFYIHYGWMEPWMDKIRNEWLVMNTKECCHHIPPENAVIIHVRDFKEDEELNPQFQPSVYIELLDRMYFQNNNKKYILWIVCQPGDVGIDLVKTLQEKYSATIVPGDDPVDAFCTLVQAHQLVLSTHSTFSQMAALLSPHHSEKGKKHEIHYLLVKKKQPAVTLVVPEWRYHLVNDQTKDSIQEYDVDVSAIEAMMS